MASNPRQGLPAVNEVLEAAALREPRKAHGHERTVAIVRDELSTLRVALAEGISLDGNANPEMIAARVAERLARENLAKLRPVINATGIVLHTNLGRAPMAEEAAKAAYEAARGYLNLELDLASGKRSSRQSAIRQWIIQLTGVESATVVNNNAAATVIALRALCQGKEVIISRGQLIEIGGGFRIPEIMGVSGAILKEVGTTNITRWTDYENAIGANTAAILRIHTSNYRVSGFTESVPLPELVALGKRRGLLVIDDIGSGALGDFAKLGFHDEPLARASIEAGADLVLFSGDKLLGGPQSGILAGKKELIERIERDPMMRAFRCDKMTLAALEVTLRLYLNAERVWQHVPVLRMLAEPFAELHKRTAAFAERLRPIQNLKSVTIKEEVAYVGGGSLPDQAMKTWVVEIEANGLSDTELAERLRTGTSSVVGRVKDGNVLLDLRTVFERQEPDLIEAVRKAMQ